MKNGIIKNSLGIFFALIVGVCTGLPSFVAPMQLGSAYHGVPFINDNDENTYRARVQEILDGHIWVSSPNVYEYKTAPGVIPPINEFFYAIPALLFGLSNVIVASKFVLPAALFFLTYLLVLRLLSVGRSENDNASSVELSVLSWTAVASGLFVILGMSALDFHAILPLLSGEGQSYVSTIWTRLVNPILGGLILFTFLLSLLFVLKEQGRYAIVLAGLSMGLSVGYFFSFGIIACTLLFAILVFLVIKDLVRLKRLMAILAIGIVSSLPYWILAFGAIGGVEGRLHAARNGMFFMHDPVINKFLLAISFFALISFCYAYIYRRNKDHILEWQYLFIMLFGCWIAFNQQIITGRTIWYYHFAQYSVPIGFIIFFAVSYLVWRKEFPKLYVAVLGVFVAGSVGLLLSMSLSYRYHMEAFKASQQHEELFSFINTYGEKDCVVFIKEESDLVEQMIPAQTQCNVYSTTYAFNGVPRDRVLHNFLLRMRLSGVNVEDSEEYLLAHHSEVRNYFFDNWTEIFGSGVDEWLLGRTSMIRDAYGKFVDGNLYQQITEYRIDFLITKSELPQSIFEELQTPRLVATTTEYYVYEFRPTK